MAPVISDCIQMAVRGTQPSGSWANVFHVIELGGGGASAEDLAKDFVQDYVDTILLGLTAQITVVDCAYVDLSSVTGDSGVVSPVTGPFTGGQTGFGASTNVAVLVNWGAAGSRSQRNGRSYLPGVDEDQVDTAGLLTSGYRTELQGDVEDFVDALQGHNMALVINSKTGTGSYEPRTITTWTVDSRVATQRRRLRR